MIIFRLGVDSINLLNKFEQHKTWFFLEAYVSVGLAPHLVTVSELDYVFINSLVFVHAYGHLCYWWGRGRGPGTSSRGG